MKARIFLLVVLGFVFTACPISPFSSEESKPGEVKTGRQVFFIGVDISESFMRSGYFNDSLRFLAHYIYAHLQGYEGLEVPNDMFVGSIGGNKANEPKTFYPIQTFQHRSIVEIEKKLKEIFPTKDKNPFTDYDAFFEQVAVFVRSKRLVLKPITIVMMTDGVPDAPKKDGKHDYRSIKVAALETLARDITLRVLYTSATVGMNWRTKVPRRRVKIWTQDANVMKEWKAPQILQKKKKFADQSRFFSWVNDNVDFKVPIKKVD